MDLHEAGVTSAPKEIMKCNEQKAVELFSSSQMLLSAPGNTDTFGTASKNGKETYQDCPGWRSLSVLTLFGCP